MTTTLDTSPPPTRASVGTDDPPPGPRLLADRGPGPLVVPADLVAEVRRAGLRGRGGAAFPTAVKLDAVRRAAAGGRRRPVVVANGTESEPLSAKDRALLLTNPHLVLDGVAVAAAAVGADRAHVCVKAGNGTRVALERALAERPRRDDLTIAVVEVPPRYLAGEESSLINWIDRRRSLPTLTPPRPAERGVGRRPTLVDNVETLAHLALIARHGARWWSSVGTAEAPGTVLTTLGGAVRHPGVLEVAGGTSVAEVLARAGTPDLSTSSGVLVGGYFGTWHRPEEAGTVLLGPGTGCGAVAVLPGDVCPLVETARVARWLAGQSAGQCGPCVHGLPAIADALDDVVDGRPDQAGEVARLSDVVRGRGGCRLPDGAIALVASALSAFADHLVAHRAGPCPHAGAAAVLPTPSWKADR
jgi:NADH:ubiquinone oxidoreductase subunit F (NADH-binding)